MLHSAPIRPLKFDWKEVQRLSYLSINNTTFSRLSSDHLLFDFAHPKEVSFKSSLALARFTLTLPGYCNGFNQRSLTRSVLVRSKFTGPKQLGFLPALGFLIPGKLD